MKDLENLLAGMTPELYERLVLASETGKWPDGVALTPAQREHTLQLVMLWQARYNDNPGHMTIGKGGEMVVKSKQALKEEFGIDGSVTKLTL
ncbi:MULTISPECIES: YeaC family protein [Tatumella]|uniref:YeaC family protein n=2 Tax=Tatumella ptyseos TaxID=82987 RepID=A0A085JEB1_9GAMM|nr:MULTISPECIES: DUF1315 family protein [Tatumella]KFD18807.1 YeaC family protein [Tatumella ptyseos ATCC 33301]SQK75110.1 Protein of uncharacterised function (DUF1315) [Tatumella ptyseos]